MALGTALVTVAAQPATELSPAPHEQGRGRHSAPVTLVTERLSTRVDAALLAALIAFAAVLRLVNVGSSYDVYVDELFYSDVARNVGRGQIPPLNPAGWSPDRTQAFLLHPPGFFVLLGLWQHLTGLGGSAFHQVYEARGLNALLAVLTVPVLYTLGRWLVGRWAGAAAAVLFALDPFVLRQNGRVLLETATLLWITAGYLVLVGIAQGRFRRPRLAAVVCGLFFGCAILTKDIAAIETVGALGALVLLGWGVPRRLGLLSIATSAAMYGAYAITCVVQGFGGELWSAKTLGVRRMLGLVQTTGFNRRGSVSLSGTLWSRAADYGMSYLVIALGTAAAVWLLSSRRDDFRVLAFFVGSAAVLLGYAVLFGTIEEQFLYFLSVPAILAGAVVAGDVPRRSRRRSVRAGDRLRAVSAVAVVAVALWNVGVWVQVRFTPDNATEQAVAWLHDHLPKSALVAFSTAGQQHFMTASGITTVPLGLPGDMAAEHVTYVMLTSRISDLNYSFVGNSALTWYQRHSHRVFVTHTPTQGTVGIYRTTNPELW